MITNWLLKIPYMGMNWLDTTDFIELIMRFALDFFVAFIVIRLIYYPIHKRKDYLFTYFMFNILIFFICTLLSGVKLKLGFAFGLFAIFGVLRYRTEQLPIKEMTYLFMIIGISIINSLSGKKTSLAEVLFVNVGIVVATYLLEKVWLLKNESRKYITYEKIELIKPEHHEALINDLKERTGLDIHRVQIGRVDFLRDAARIIIFYYEENPNNSFSDEPFVTNQNE